MKTLISSSIACLLLAAVPVAAGPVYESPVEPPDDTGKLELAVESGVLFGINNPNDYVLAPLYLHLDVAFIDPLRPGDGSWEIQLPVVVTGGVIPIVNGPESLWAGGALGMKFLFTRDGSPLSWYLRVHGGMGGIDSRGAVDGQGQDFTFTIIAAAGVQYQMGDSWTLAAGLMYQHISNAGLSEPESPNVGLDSIGPVISISKRF